MRLLGIFVPVLLNLKSFITKGNKGVTITHSNWPAKTIFAMAYSFYWGDYMKWFSV